MTCIFLEKLKGIDYLWNGLNIVATYPQFSRKSWDVASPSRDQIEALKNFQSLKTMNILKFFKISRFSTEKIQILITAAS